MTKTGILLAGMALSMAPLAEAVVIRSAVTTGGAADPTFNALISSFRSALVGAGIAGLIALRRRRSA